MRLKVVPLAVAALASACSLFRGPVTVARAPLPQCSQGTLGLEPTDISRALRTSLALPAGLTGAAVASVIPGGPADKAGIVKNDVVVRIGTAGGPLEGKAITNACELIDAAFDRHNCDPVVVGLLRGGEEVRKMVVPVDQAPFFKKSCAAGEVEGCFRLGWLTWSGDGVLHDEDRAMEIYADACARGSAEACAFRGLHMADDDEAHADDVVATLTRGCDLGSGSACAHLGYLYATGRLVSRDDARATPLYVRACELGEARGCYNVGLMYADGRGVAVDVARAISAYEEGCRGGSTTACTNLGFHYEYGEGVTKDPHRSFELYERGCKATSCQPSNLRGCVNLGRAYRDGIGVAVDAKRAADLFADACRGATNDEDPDADENQARACALLGALYLTGNGVKTDLAEGLDLSERACEMNDSFGCFNAGRIWATGLGVDADPTKAAGFYRTACDGDDGEACFELAQLVDAELAPALRKKACKLGFEKACQE